MDCSTIIVSYNTFELTRDAVASALEAAEGIDHEIIVVDNKSPDGSAQLLQDCFPRTNYPNVTIIANDTNSGFSRANNIGAVVASGKVLFFLNSDTIAYPRSISTLCHFLLSHSEAGAVGPRVYNPDGTFQVSTGPFYSASMVLQGNFPVLSLLTGAFRRRFHFSDPFITGVTAVDVVLGCALALRREAFDKVGGWDESYFMYFEEVELCHSLKAAGFTNYYLRDAHIMHYGQGSSMDRYVEHQLLGVRSAVRYLRRHHGVALRALHRVTGALGYGARSLIFTVLKHTSSDSEAQYSLRQQAAARLFYWYLFSYK